MKNCVKDRSQSNGTVNLMDGGDAYDPDQHETDLADQQPGSTIDDETSVKMVIKSKIYVAELLRVILKLKLQKIKQKQENLQSMHLEGQTESARNQLGRKLETIECL